MDWARGDHVRKGGIIFTVYNVANVRGVLKLQFAPGGKWHRADALERVA